MDRQKIVKLNNDIAREYRNSKKKYGEKPFRLTINNNQWDLLYTKLSKLSFFIMCEKKGKFFYCQEIMIEIDI